MSRRHALPRATIPPIYPTLIAAAFVVIQFGVWNAPVEALPRPLLLAVLFGIATQIAGTTLLRSADRGALAALFAILLVIGHGIVIPALVALILVGGLVVMRRQRGLTVAPWRRASTIINSIAMALLVIPLVTAAFDGALTSPANGPRAARGVPAAGAPDIYFLLLDAYPRADTLAKDFAYDNSAFLDGMKDLGFEVPTHSHSNYDVTVLTLASMLNGAQIPALVPNPPSAIPAQYHLLTRLINEGRQLDAFRTAGYEIVSLPSEFGEAAILSADRVLDSGQMSTFEMAMLSSGLPEIIGLGETLLPEEHRARVRTTLATLPELAAERSSTPKLVFAHVVSPHMPIAFDRTGGAATPLSCFPQTCSMFSFSDEYGPALIGPMRDQIAYLNDAVTATVRGIQEHSATPPVIVIFSDHGLRYNRNDPDEMFRSLFLAATPGHRGVFPDDVTPVNVMARLRNAYTGAQAQLVSEESYWVDARSAPTTGVFPGPLQPIR